MKRSIALPSNRNFGRSMEAIDSAEFYCDVTGTELAVSDNSGDPNKEAVWRNKNYYKTSEPCVMTENFYKALDSTSGEFVIVMGDDDRIFSLNEADIKVESNVVGIHPAVVAFTPEHGIIKADATELNALTAKGRVEQFIMQCNGSNLSFYSFWRRDVFKSVIDLWFNHHPTKGAYCDWAVMKGLASSGKMINDPSTVYFYNISNWAGNNEQLNSQIEKSYVDCGLEKEVAKYAAEIQAVDSFIFINRQDSPTPKDERLEAAQHCIGEMDWNEALKMVASFGLEDKYREFYLHATGKDWGHS